MIESRISPFTIKHVPTSAERALKSAVTNGRGQGNGRGRFTDEQKAEIIKRVSRFESPTKIAKEYGCTLRAISYIMKSAGH